MRASVIVKISGFAVTNESGGAAVPSEVTVIWMGNVAPFAMGASMPETAQTRQVHENLKACLAAAGATFADVCKVTVFVKNVDDREKINTVRKDYFGASRPTSTLVEISRFVRDGALVEIDAIAVVPG